MTCPITDEDKRNGLTFLTDSIYFIQKSRVGAQLRVGDLAKRGEKCDLTTEALSRYLSFEKWMNEELRSRMKNHPAHPWFSMVKGIGDLNIGKVIGYIDIHKATNISKLWRYAGFAVIDGRGEKPVAKQKLHYNSKLKSMCWRIGKALIRAKGAYYSYYKEQKAELIDKYESQGRKVIPAADLPKKDNKKIETAEFISLGHVDIMAMRKMIKLFLSHLWIKWREAEGLEITLPYIHEIGGHTSYMRPEEFIDKAVGAKETNTMERANLEEKTYETKQAGI